MYVVQSKFIYDTDIRVYSYNYPYAFDTMCILGMYGYISTVVHTRTSNNMTSNFNILGFAYNFVFCRVLLWSNLIL